MQVGIQHSYKSVFFIICCLKLASISLLVFCSHPIPTCHSWTRLTGRAGRQGSIYKRLFTVQMISVIMDVLIVLLLLCMGYCTHK